MASKDLTKVQDKKHQILQLYVQSLELLLESSKLHRVCVVLLHPNLDAYSTNIFSLGLAPCLHADIF